MSRWFRFYDDAINDPKVQRLPAEQFKAWVNMLCLASKNDGVLPSIPDMAFALRMHEEAISGLLNAFYAMRLLDEVERENDAMGYAPHNWNTRQYKSDDSKERVKRYRDRKRNGEVTVTVTPPETEQKQITETEQKTEANASGADAPRDVRTVLFSDGLETLARITGKTPNACRSFVGKCLKAADDNAITVLGLIEEAERNRIADPAAWIAASLKATGPPGQFPAKPLTQFQQDRKTTQDILNGLDNYATGRSGSGQAHIGLLPGHSGQRPAGIRSGVGADIVDLPAGSGRTSLQPG